MAAHINVKSSKETAINARIVRYTKNHKISNVKNAEKYLLQHLKIPVDRPRMLLRDEEEDFSARNDYKAHSFYELVRKKMY